METTSNICYYKVGIITIITNFVWSRKCRIAPRNSNQTCEGTQTNVLILLYFKKSYFNEKYQIIPINIFFIRF